MNKEEFLQKYGNEEVVFVELYKFRARYKSTTLNIWCSGIIEYRDSLEIIETINSISQLEEFEFGFIK